MIRMPDYERSFDYENSFYLTGAPSRLAKVVAHYELLKRVATVPGAIVECGVFKGASFACLAMMRSVLDSPHKREMIGFDTFDFFPETTFEEDREKREAFISEAGDESISRDQLTDVLAHKGCADQVQLVEGNICDTVPRYVAEHPDLRIAFLNLDTDIYEPAVTILEYLYPLISPGGVLVLDDYGVFPGETKAVNDYFVGKNITIQRFPFRETPCYVVRS
jgi:hypothetical protein